MIFKESKEMYFEKAEEQMVSLYLFGLYPTVWTTKVHFNRRFQ